MDASSLRGADGHRSDRPFDLEHLLEKENGKIKFRPMNDSFALLTAFVAGAALGAVAALLLAPSDGKTLRGELRSLAEEKLKDCGVNSDSAPAEPVQE